MQALRPFRGFPDRAPRESIYTQFVNPPGGYGEVAFYWWEGDPLTRERLRWQLDRLKGRGVEGLQINLSHTDAGGQSFGLSDPSDPPVFSEDWWELLRWYIGECRREGISVSLSDYTLATPGQGYWTDEILREHPDICGSALVSSCLPLAAGRVVSPRDDDDLLCACAYREGEGVDVLRLRDFVPEVEGWQLLCVRRERRPLSLNPMDARLGALVVEKFFKRFEDRFPGASGEVFNFFFSDELDFKISGMLWDDDFARRFEARNGYDIRPLLAALFVDIGDITPKVRMDYYDMIVRLSEDGFFRPVYDWHQAHGMIYGCDHGGRGQDVVEFGDYFRTQRWNQGPGCDQPALQENIVKNKVASSIAHLYERPRVWLEGFHSSGWGTTSDELTRATLANFVSGQNLLTLHGLYYSTHGGWWEWAPPCNHFRMPYWKHIDCFLAMTRRLSYVLSQGVHRCDVAICYPVAPMEAGMEGKAAVRAAFETARALYDRGIDFDFIDFESLERARVEGAELCVAGERYRAVVLPAMRAVRWGAMVRVAEFAASGGVALALGALPCASERQGRNDALLSRLVKTAFPNGALESVADGIEALRKRVSPDFVAPPEVERAWVMHRALGPDELYMVYGAPRGGVCTFRATGQVSLWNPWTGERREIAALAQDERTTTLALPLEAHEAQLIVFSPGRARLRAPEQAATAARAPVTPDGLDRLDGPDRPEGLNGPDGLSELDRLGKPDGLDGPGKPNRLGEPVEPDGPDRLDGLWKVRLLPTLDNAFGDFRQPPSGMIGAQARILRYENAAFSDDQAMCGYGPQGMMLGPVAHDAELEARLRQARGAGDLPGGARLHAFSWRYGIWEDPGHQGYHGLKEKMDDCFLAFGARRQRLTDCAYDEEIPGGKYYFFTTVHAPRDLSADIESGGVPPECVYIDGQPVDIARPVRLARGAHALLVRYGGVGRAYCALVDADARRPERRSPLAMRWYGMPGLLAFDVFHGRDAQRGVYRFRAPSGFSGLSFGVRGIPALYVDGKREPLSLTGGKHAFRAPSPYRAGCDIEIHLAHEPGAYAGAAFDDPIDIETDEGETELGDWARNDVLACYSGGMRYEKAFELPRGGDVCIDLGRVGCSAEVFVDGASVGTLLCAPYRVQCKLGAGAHVLAVEVYSALSGHYKTIPTRYRGEEESGLIGPVLLWSPE